MNDTEPVICRYCGAKLAARPEPAATTAWWAPAAEDPDACDPAAPGHAPDRINVQQAARRY